MSPDDLADVAQTLGLNTSDLAMITGNTIRAVQYWFTGKNPVPQSVALLLNAMASGHLEMDWVADEVSRLLQAKAEGTVSV